MSQHPSPDDQPVEATPSGRPPVWQRNLAIVFVVATAAMQSVYAFNQRLLTAANAATVDNLTNRSTAYGIATYWLSLVALLFTILWMWRARSNAENFDGDGFRHGRGWTIGGWFCPIVNLWFPFEAMADVWTASTPDRDSPAVFRTVRPSYVVVIWWLALVASQILPRLASFIRSPDASASDYQTSFRFDYAGAVTAVLAAWAASYIMIKVTGWQKQRYLDPRFGQAPGDA